MIHRIAASRQRQKVRESKEIELVRMNRKMDKHRKFQRQTYLISIMAAFVIGISLGIFVPVIGLGTEIAGYEQDIYNNKHALPTTPYDHHQVNDNVIGNTANDDDDGAAGEWVQQKNHVAELQFPIIYNMEQHENLNMKNSYAVNFVTEGKQSIYERADGEQRLQQPQRQQQQRQQQRKETSYLREFNLERIADGKHAPKFFKPHQKQQPPMFLTNFRRTNKNVNKKYIAAAHIDGDNDRSSTATTATTKNASTSNGFENPFAVIDEDVFWSKVIEDVLPNGFDKRQIDEWTAYVNSGKIKKLETGCGRMQNRLITFADGRQACARYRQNTDQIQGELFSFYFGQLLNLTNLVPSAAAIIDLESENWLNAADDIQSAQWKSQRAVVLTDWIPNLEASHIPAPFQPIERHLNKYDVENITRGNDVSNKKPSRSLLLDRLGANNRKNPKWNQLPVAAPAPVSAPSRSNGKFDLTKSMLHKLVELAQWSDLIVFDYLIANLDRVVNNLYNYQWNADIMAAPAHNLARQRDSQLLVFLDNESGLLHGYRLLKKYETYHGLLLDNLCVFRRPTINALRQLQSDGIGKRLQQLFEQSTTDKVRDVLPSLPDKSIKILVDRIDRVLNQVEKCREFFANR